MRLIKTLDEIKGIRKANQIIAKIYTDIIPPYLKPGITTREIDRIIDEYIRSCGARPACIGVEGIYGPFPSCNLHFCKWRSCSWSSLEIELSKKEIIVSLDTVTELDGYYGDSARTFAIGIIDDESRKLLEVTEKAREIGIQTAVAGNRLGDVGHAIQTFVEQNDFSVVRDFAGHGVGLALHEEPMIPNYGRKGRGLKIENGMVLAIEPMVNAGTYKIAMLPDGWTIITRDGKRSAHFEHSIAIIDGKPVILSELD